MSVPVYDLELTLEPASRLLSHLPRLVKDYCCASVDVLVCSSLLL